MSQIAANKSFPTQVEYLANLASSGKLQATIRDADDVTAVGVVEAGGKEGTVAHMVHALSW